MELDETQAGLERALAQLQAVDSPPWSERAELASRLSDSLRSIKAPDALGTASRLLRRLAADEKWEVRKATAESLMHLRTDEFDVLISRLANDSNAWVRKAAERTLARRRRIEQVETKKLQRIEGVLNEYDWFVNKYGQTAADRALRIGERYFEILASAATHEIRGILTSLSGALDRLAADERIEPDQRPNLKKALERVTFLGRVLDDMKGYAQEITCEFQRENLRDIIDAAIELVDDKLRPTERDLSQIMLDNQVPDFISVDASRHQLVQVFANVVRNAVEATEDDGRVQLAAELRDEGQVELHVTDDGVGMSADEVKDAFMPFKTSKKNQGGTGFGLPIAKKLVEAHGGTITMRSAEDEGTTVIITLPVTQQDRPEE